MEAEHPQQRDGDDVSCPPQEIKKRLTAATPTARRKTKGNRSLWTPETQRMGHPPVPLQNRVKGRKSHAGYFRGIPPLRNESHEGWRTPCSFNWLDIARVKTPAAQCWIRTPGVSAVLGEAGQLRGEIIQAYPDQVGALVQCPGRTGMVAQILWDCEAADQSRLQARGTVMLCRGYL